MEQASLAATVEVNSQIERWGEVEDSECVLLEKPCCTLTSLRVAHDVDYQDIRRQLGSAALLLSMI